VLVFISLFSRPYRCIARAATLLLIPVDVSFFCIFVVVLLLLCIPLFVSIADRAAAAEEIIIIIAILIVSLSLSIYIYLYIFTNGMRVCVCVCEGATKLLLRDIFLSLFLNNTSKTSNFGFFLSTRGKKKLLCPPSRERNRTKKRAKKVKNVSQFERWSDDSHAIERTRDVENTRQENSKVNPFARCIERDRG